MPTLAAILAFAAGAYAPELPLLSPAFGDHMVLQRDRPNTFWGWAAPGTEVRVSIAGRSATGHADASGKWTARIDPPAVGGPYAVTVEGPRKIELRDVMVGDVWICSGQSNMEMGIANVANAAAEIAASEDPGLRLYMVPKATAFDPLKVNAGAWAPSNPKTVVDGGWGGFSAVGYFFGRELRKRLGVPIGLVETSWGGTIAEAWTSRGSIERFGDFNAALATIDAAKSRATVPYERQVDDWLAKNDPGVKAHWEGDVASGWQTVILPTTYEKSGLADFDGTVWYRRDIELPATLPSGDVHLTLGPIDDIDVTYVNGKRIGGTYLYNAERVYTIPASALRPGRNTIVVQTLDTGGQGGFMGTPERLSLELGDGTKMSLAGEWSSRKGLDLKSVPPVPRSLTDNPNVPTVLYNGMIAPIVPLAFKGAIWYQGESNSGRAEQYGRLLPTMIADWRRSFKQGDFPFYIVQLANFMAKQNLPVEDEWAELREAQAMTAKRVKNSGLAVAIDIGDPGDIHPKNKQDVGLRLALNALHGAYGQNVVYSGPTYRSMKKEGSVIRLQFDHTDGGLVAKGGKLPAFAIAGSDRKWVWADARIEGDSIVVGSPRVTDPVAVRYAWEANPDATLYNGAGLPAVPFRTDNWPRLTAGRK